MKYCGGGAIVNNIWLQRRWFRRATVYSRSCKTSCFRRAVGGGLASERLPAALRSTDRAKIAELPNLQSDGGRSRQSGHRPERRQSLDHVSFQIAPAPSSSPCSYELPFSCDFVLVKHATWATSVTWRVVRCAQIRCALVCRSSPTRPSSAGHPPCASLTLAGEGEEGARGGDKVSRSRKMRSRLRQAHFQESCLTNP